MKRESGLRNLLVIARFSLDLANLDNVRGGWSKTVLGSACFPGNDTPLRYVTLRLVFWVSQTPGF
jgi:hypothetical protein